MAFSKDSIQSKALSESGGQLDMVADTMGVERERVRSELSSELADVVATLLNRLPGIIRWFISEEWAAELVVAVAKVFGEKALDWLSA